MAVHPAAAAATSAVGERRRRRSEVLRSLGAGPADMRELIAYGENPFEQERLARFDSVPLPDELFVEAWREYAAIAEGVGVVSCLRERLVQLRFPIQAGVSGSHDYRRATRAGVRPTDDRDALLFERPASIRLHVHPSPAGAVPVLIAEHRPDFVSLVQAFTRRNEPDPVPDSVGASIVSGYNNWDRVERLRDDWLAGRALGGTHGGWPAAFNEIKYRKELYQDRFILLSTGPYSGVSAADVGLSETDWLDTSLTIRLEHELTHYLTRRVFGQMRNNLLDEIVADYAGIAATRGRFRADWLLRFMGLDPWSASAPRTGGRLAVYRGSPPLSHRAFAIVAELLRAAAAQLERYDDMRFAPRAGRDPHSRTAMIAALTSLTLEELASDQAESLLDLALARLPAGWR